MKKFSLKNVSIGFYVIGTLAFVAQVGCATSDLDREQRAQIKAQQPADSPEQIMERASLAFSNAPGLTPDQKAKLSGVYSRVYVESSAIRRELGQAKSLLFMTIAKIDYTDREVVNLKNRIVKLDQRRLNIMFKALEDVQKIVGRGVEAEKIFKHFEDHEMPRYKNGTRVE